jgi:hypothetical protein
MRPRPSNPPAYFILWVALFVVFLWPLLALQKSFIIADFFDQHLPWAYEYWKAILEGRWPLWTRGMAGGFPLAAEGQIGVFYPGNILAYRFLPFLTAYTWLIPLHIALGSVGMFFYARRLGIGREGAWLAAVLFAFGSNYGGCQYNAGSLRVITWLPWALSVCEGLRRSPSVAGWIGGFGGLAILIGLQGTAGASQIALYAAVYLVAHEMFAGSWAGAVHRGAVAAAGVALGVLIAAPQWMLTAELASLSVRAGQPMSFALWGAASPLFPVSLIFPSWGNAMGVSFYLGLLPVFLIVVACCFERAASARRHIWLALLFGSFALGGLNPVYRYGIEWSGMTGMRVPAKWLIFCCFSLSVLAAWGWDRLSRRTESDPPLHALLKYCKWIPFIAVLLPLIGMLIAKTSRPIWNIFSEGYVRNLIAERGVRAKSPEYYLNGMNAFFDRLPALFSFREPAVMHAILFSILGFALLTMRMKSNLKADQFRWAAVVVLFIDLCCFGFIRGVGFIGHAQPISRLVPDTGLRQMIAHVNERGGSWAEFSVTSTPDRLPPNAGMYYDLEHAGAYTPLLLRTYDALAGDLGIADASLGRPAASQEVWARERGVLDLLGVRWIRSTQPLDLRGLSTVFHEGNDRLYENLQALPDITGVYSARVIEDLQARLAYLKSSAFDPRREIVLSQMGQNLTPLENRNQLEPALGRLVLNTGSRLDFEIEMGREGIVRIRNAAYPGWKAEVDGQPADWFEVDHAFMGLWMGPGAHQIRLAYKPTHWYEGLAGSAIGWLFAVGCMLIGYLWRRPKLEKLR